MYRQVRPSYSPQPLLGGWMSPRYSGYGLTVPSFNPGAVTTNTNTGGVTGPTATFVWDPTLMFGPGGTTPVRDGGDATRTSAPASDGDVASTTFTFNTALFDTGATYSPFDVQSPFTGGAPARDGGDAQRVTAPASPDGTDTGLTQSQYRTTAQLPGQQAQYSTGGAKLPPVPGGGGTGAGVCAMPTSSACPKGQLPLPNGSCIDPYAACKSQGQIYNPCVKADGCSPAAAGGTGGTASSGTTMAIVGAAALAALFLLR